MRSARNVFVVVVFRMFSFSMVKLWKKSDEHERAKEERTQFSFSFNHNKIGDEGKNGEARETSSLTLHLKQQLRR